VLIILALGTPNIKAVKPQSRLRKKTTTMTFRLESDIIERLKIKVQQDETTLNTLVNRVLRRYIEWGIFLEDRLGIILLTRPVAQELFSRLEKDQIVRLATEVGKSAVIDLTLFMKGGVNSSLFMEWFLSRMKESSAVVASKSNSDESKSYVIKHDMGENWSLYHKTVVEAIFEEMQKPIHITATKSALIIEIKE
jgi:hypothetical protein